MIFKITFLLLIFCLAWMDSELSRLIWWWRILTSLSLAQVSDGKSLNIFNFWMSRLICDIIIRLEIENNVLLSLWGPCGQKCLLELNFQSPFRKLHLLVSQIWLSYNVWHIKQILEICAGLKKEEQLSCMQNVCLKWRGLMSTNFAYPSFLFALFSISWQATSMLLQEIIWTEWRMAVLFATWGIQIQKLMW